MADAAANDELSPTMLGYRAQRASVRARAATVAGAQWGVIGWDQLRDCGASMSTADRWRANGTLHPMHHRVYAFGHPSVPIEGHLVAALLYAGPDAVLSRATAAWWWGLIAEEPKTIEVSSRSRVRPTAGVTVHHPRQLNATRHRRFPITTVPQTLLDYAATAPYEDLRHALANADFRGLLDIAALNAVLGRGRAGSASLRAALAHHQPRLAYSRSRFERLFLELCEQARLPTPEVNVFVEGVLVDAVWRQERVVVELDGYDNHRSRAQIRRDRRNELRLRAAGFLILRYAWAQLLEEPAVLAADLLTALSQTARWAVPGSR